MPAWCPYMGQTDASQDGVYRVPLKVDDGRDWYVTPNSRVRDGQIDDSPLSGKRTGQVRATATLCRPSPLPAASTC